MLKTLADWITAARFILSLALFGVLTWMETLAPANRTELVWTSLVLFVVAALTDTIDGIVARRYGMSDFGRIADPFVDKVLVVGALVFLATFDESRRAVPAWAVVVIVAREFLVTGVRGYVESKGHAFPADAWGKLKMVLQCLTVGGGILCLVPRDPAAADVLSKFLGAVPAITRVCLALSLVTTIGSGVAYLVRATRFFAPPAAARP